MLTPFGEEKDMKIISFGSMNMDKVYQVENFVRPGETIHAKSLHQAVGGKGLNQSVAAARAGATVIHAGAVGEDGGPLTEMLEKAGADVSSILTLPGQSGHAIIQVDSQGDNCIIVFGGSNQSLTKEYIHRILREKGQEGDIVLLQNETNLVPYIMKQAHQAGFQVAFNPSPIPTNIGVLPLECVDFFLVNKGEGAAMAALEGDTFSPEEVLEGLSAAYPAACLVLTLGSEGVLCKVGTEVYAHAIYPVKPVDTTGAGDTFCGYFLAGICQGKPIDQCLERASAAAALAVSRPGAAPSIPVRAEVEDFLRSQETE